MRLTKTEKRAVRLLLECMSYREIAQKMGTNSQVIRNLMQGVRDKIGADDKTGIAIFCIAHPEYLDGEACEECGKLK
jgi:DNA-binding CsgD family transcriptional regulator